MNTKSAGVSVVAAACLVIPNSHWRDWERRRWVAARRKMDVDIERGKFVVGRQMLPLFGWPKLFFINLLEKYLGVVKSDLMAMTRSVEGSSTWTWPTNWPPSGARSAAPGVNFEGSRTEHVWRLTSSDRRRWPEWWWSFEFEVVELLQLSSPRRSEEAKSIFLLKIKQPNWLVWNKERS
jgi:hypothetical protein